MSFLNSVLFLAIISSDVIFAKSRGVCVCVLLFIQFWFCFSFWKLLNKYVGTSQSIIHALQCLIFLFLSLLHSAELFSIIF